MSEQELAALRAVAHDCIENLGHAKKPGWSRAAIPMGKPFSWDDLHSLRDHGWVEWSDDYMDAWLRITDAGWAALSTGVAA